MAVTVPDVAAWLSISDGDQLTTVTPALQRVLDAVKASIASTHKLPDTPTAGQQAAWDRAVSR